MRTHRIVSLYLLSILFFGTLLCRAGNPRLPDAAKDRNTVALRSLLSHHVDPNQRLSDGSTALLWAAHWDDLEAADLLVRAGADVNAANQYGVTALSLACTNGSTEMAQRLLQAGADPNLAMLTGETPLMTAARSGSASVVRLLLEQGVKMEAKESAGGQTALMWAVSQKHPSVVKLLIEHGADVHARSKGGFTPLLFATRQGDVESAQLLVQAGANVNEVSPPIATNRAAILPSGLARVVEPQGPVTPLLMAAASGQEAVAIFFLEHGADPNATDINGTALHYAMRKGLSYINRKDSNGGGDQPWNRAPNMAGLAKALLEHGANPNARLLRNPSNGATANPVGATPFLLAAASDDPEMMRLLLAHGADPMLGTEKNTTPLMVAAGVGRTEDRVESDERNALVVVKMLVGLGASINAANDDYLETPLHGAARIGADQMIEYLVSQGARIDVMNRGGETPLSIALDITTKGSSGRNPVGPHPSTAALLLKLGATPLEASGVERMDIIQDSGNPKPKSPLDDMTRDRK